MRGVWTAPGGDGGEVGIGGWGKTEDREEYCGRDGEGGRVRGRVLSGLGL